ETLQIGPPQDAHDSAARAVLEREDSREVVLDAGELLGRRRYGSEAVDLVKDFLERRTGDVRGHVGLLRPVGHMVVIRDVTEWRVGVSLVLTDVARDARAEGAAEERIGDLKGQVILIRRVGDWEAQDERGLHRIGPVDQRYCAAGIGGGQIRGRGIARGPVSEGIANGALNGRDIEHTGYIQVRARRA